MPIAQPVPEAKPWQYRAACEGKPRLFFVADANAPADDPIWAEAKAICAGCPVRLDCLDYAMRNRETDGVWGGLDPAQRRKLRRQ